MADMIAKCFADYFFANWVQDNSPRPFIHVIDINENPGDYFGTHKLALLFNRGEMQFFIQDIGADSTDGGTITRQWRADCFIHGSDSKVAQGIFNEFFRLLIKWQSSGGGAFSSEDTDLLKVVQDFTLEYKTDQALNVYYTINGFYEEGNV